VAKANLAARTARLLQKGQRLAWLLEPSRAQQPLRFPPAGSQQKGARAQRHVEQVVDPSRIVVRGSGHRGGR
jgi:hypothetical protein